MGFACGVVGLPNVGKSTLFNALTQSEIAAENYPFCTIEPNVGLVAVPDVRLHSLANLVKPKKTLPTTMRFVDIAGLVAGAAQGEGLGNKFLSHIRETQAIAHVVRCYEDPDVVHVSGTIDPVADIETIQIELLLSDLQTIDKAIVKNAKLVKTGDKEARLSQACFEKIKAALESETPIRLLSLTEEEQIIVQPYGLLTAKPMFYIANVAEDGFVNNNYLDAVNAYAAKQATQVVPICATFEAELGVLDMADQLALLNEIDLNEPGLHRVIRAGYALLGLCTYFTAGPKEVRAWTVTTGSKAPDAAAVIHTDFKKGFVRAEVVGYKDYIAQGGEQGAKTAGLWRLEGKEYIVQDGDVIFFRIA